MSASGVGSVDLSGGSVGLNPAAMMAGMAVGGAVGQNIAGAMSSIIAGVNSPAQGGVIPPPIPAVAYHVAINGQAAGPYDINVLTTMASTGRFSADTLVWKVGMSQWTKAGAMDELKNIFVNMPPIPPIE